MTSYDSGKTNVLAAKDADKGSDDGLRGPGRKGRGNAADGDPGAGGARDRRAHTPREPGARNAFARASSGENRRHLAFPVRAALRYLADLGVVRSDSNKGFFLQASTGDLLAVSEKFSSAAEGQFYLKVAEYRPRHGKLPDVVAETDLMRIFSVSRFVIQRAFSRIQKAGSSAGQAGLDVPAHDRLAGGHREKLRAAPVDRARRHPEPLVPARPADPGGMREATGVHLNWRLRVHVPVRTVRGLVALPRSHRDLLRETASPCRPSGA